MTSTDADVRDSEIPPTSRGATAPKPDLPTSKPRTSLPQVLPGREGLLEERSPMTSGEHEELERLPTQDPKFQTTPRQRLYPRLSYPGAPRAKDYCPMTPRAPSCTNARAIQIPWELTDGSASFAYASSQPMNQGRSMFNDAARPSQKDGAVPPPCENDIAVNPSRRKGVLQAEPTRAQVNPKGAFPALYRTPRGPCPKGPPRDKEIFGPT